MFSLTRFHEAQKYPITCSDPLDRLPELAYNLWWSWDSEAQALFRAIDAKHWQTHHNPVKLLRERARTVQRFGKDKGFIKHFHKVLGRFDDGLEISQRWFARTHPAHAGAWIAYFSPEFGLHESLPIYSGGLGVLAGDHLKTASDLGVSMVGVGLLYKHGYFTQGIDAQGRQHAIYSKLKFDEIPVMPLRDQSGKRVVVSVTLAGRTVHAQAWLVLVGSCFLILLDTDVSTNHPKDRQITYQLYGGDRETRMAQEIVLGMGGVQALAALGIKPAVWHLNEGHVAFSCLERVRALMLEHALDFQQAQEAVAANTVFTTHTPVPAGNEAFELPLMQKYFADFCRELQIDLPALLHLGLQSDAEKRKHFSMTVLALRLSSLSNGVSQLHGEVSRAMWQHLWPEVPHAELPIAAITNGIHAGSWVAPAFAELYAEQLGVGWRDQLDDPKLWQRVHDIPDERLWRTHQECKHALIQFVREQTALRYKRNGEPAHKIQSAMKLLDAEALTIGFARRFATYKRADLIFHDLKRLEKILSDRKRPVQIIFAGKAHPRDAGGQAILQRVHRLALRKKFQGKIVLLENYDMNAGRYLVQGVDVWLNNPRRPQEASGTSGQKVPLNAGINFSVLDGWWEEGYNGKNGWKIGATHAYKSEAEQDAADATDLYRVLEKEIIPLYYQRNRAGWSRRWIKRMKESMATLIPRFTSAPMVKAYVEQLYVPSIQRGIEHAAKRFAPAVNLAGEKALLRSYWPLIQFAEIVKLPSLNGHIDRSQVNLSAKIYLAGLSPEMVQVELYPASSRKNYKAPDNEVVAMRLAKAHEHGIYEYRAVVPNYTGKNQFRVRVIPRLRRLHHKHELGLIHWSEIVS